ncbi:hypothetical protein ILYODFUR_038454 [Ilyodon furcidens]|uniref:Uncharacterized protein n=1 Tax=Ilyodon furcidens TaxID=33524 RepID=A0ABV0UPV0_9TELE
MSVCLQRDISAVSLLTVPLGRCVEEVSFSTIERESYDTPIEFYGKNGMRKSRGSSAAPALDVVHSRCFVRIFLR